MPKLPVVSCAMPEGVARRDVLRGLFALTIFYCPSRMRREKGIEEHEFALREDGRPIQPGTAELTRGFRSSGSKRACARAVAAR